MKAAFTRQPKEEPLPTDNETVRWNPYPTMVPGVEFWKDMIPCQAACPTHTDAGRYVQLIAEGKFKESYLTARSSNPFVSVCSRVCAAPCENRCRRGKIDKPVAIRALKYFVSEKYGVESLEPDTQDVLFEGATEPGNKTFGHQIGRASCRERV